MGLHTVISKDGTPIAYEKIGNGPNLVLVHGNLASRARWAPIGRTFRNHFSVVSMDRRGRGDSGDGPEYTIEREYEDIVAVVNSLDGPVLLFGHSFGAVCALEAATRTDRLAGLVLYEPAIYRDDETGLSSALLERLEARLAAGDNEGVVTMFMMELVGPDHVEAMKASPAWPGRVAAAHTLPRELRAEESYRPNPARLGRLSIPALLLLGGDSPPFFNGVISRLAAMLPNSRTVVMPGQQHTAMDTGPELLADAVVEFWQEVAKAG